MTESLIANYTPEKQMVNLMLSKEVKEEVAKEKPNKLINGIIGFAAGALVCVAFTPTIPVVAIGGAVAGGCCSLLAKTKLWAVGLGASFGFFVVLSHEGCKTGDFSRITEMLQNAFCNVKNFVQEIIKGTTIKIKITFSGDADFIKGVKELIYGYIGIQIASVENHSIGGPTFEDLSDVSNNNSPSLQQYPSIEFKGSDDRELKGFLDGVSTLNK